MSGKEGPGVHVSLCVCACVCICACAYVCVCHYVSLWVCVERGDVVRMNIFM